MNIIQEDLLEQTSHALDVVQGKELAPVLYNQESARSKGDLLEDQMENPNDSGNLMEQIQRVV